MAGEGARDFKSIYTRLESSLPSWWLWLCWKWERGFKVF